MLADLLLEVSATLRFRRDKLLGSRFDLKASDYAVLQVIARNGGTMALTELRPQISYTAAHATTMTQKLEDKGFLRRSRTANNRRTVRLQLTPKATKVLQAAEEALHDMERALGPSLQQLEVNLREVASSLGVETEG